MSRRRTGRQIKFLEHQWPWLVMLLLVTGILGAIVFLIMAQVVDVDPAAGGNNLRGYTSLGIILGGLAIVLAVLTFVYSLRKRTMQEKMPVGKATMMTWLWLHVYFGLFAILAATVHGGFGIVSGYAFSSGKLLYLVFALLAVSGLAWRLAYRFVPPVAAPKIGNYSRVGTLRRAVEQMTEVEKIAAGKSANFHHMKEAVVAHADDLRVLQQASASLPPEERADVEQIQKLAASRNRALRRVKLQEHYVRLLQGWRKIHVPLTLLFVVLLGVHVFGAFDGHMLVLPVGTVSTGPLSGFASPEECAGCHKAIYDQWTGSMHAHALTSPVTVAQNNQDIKTSLLGQPAPDPLEICINCHAPVGAALTRQETLPLPADRATEGVGCTTCHQYDGKPFPGGAGLASKLQADLHPGRTYFGPIEDPVGNGYHKSAITDVYRKPETLCINCHNVNFDLNSDGKIVRGEDLVLQQTIDEYDRYVAAGGKQTCVTCHMPLLATKRVAEGASVPLEQDVEAPPRQVHDHSFVGVDYPLDTVAKSDPQKAARTALLKGAASMHVDPEGTVVQGSLSFAIAITNTGSAHNLPTGFAFARQMWLEVKVTGPGGEALLSSGVLTANTDDLCDASTLNDPTNPLKKHFQKCATFDPQLVNFQTKLVDHIEPQREASGTKLLDEFGEVKLAQSDKGRESVLQAFTSGPVARTRPSDNQVLSPIVQGQTRTFRFTAPLPKDGAPEVSVSARLLFRNLPPYMLRALGAGQPAGETPKLAPLIANLQIVEMAVERVAVSVRPKK